MGTHPPRLSTHMKIRIPISFIAIVGLMTLAFQSPQAAAQTEADRQNPVSPTPTVPDTGTGGPKAVELDPKIPQAEPTGKMDAVPRTHLTIPEIIEGAMDFTTLAGALRAAGLSDRLKADGPYTLLAPDNDAFAALPEGVFPMLMEPDNVELLRKILTYHVIPRKVTTAELIPGNHESSQGEPLTIVGRAKGEMTIQGAKFGISDVMAKNGVIHSVKTVLIPPTITIEDFSPAGTGSDTVTETETVLEADE
jgi:uncharacterized surface protein with fasciclin (FAS1) repeats